MKSTSSAVGALGWLRSGSHHCLHATSRWPTQLSQRSISFKTPSGSAAPDEAGPSHHLARKPTSARTKPNGASTPRRKQQPALLRLDPSRPILPSLTPATERKRGDAEGGLSQIRAKKLGQLYGAIQTGSADAVWSAYLALRHTHSRNDNPSILEESSIFDGSMTAEECRRILNIISNDTTKTKRGLHRVLRLFSDVRGQQRSLLARLQHALEANDTVRKQMLTEELKAWDRVISPSLLGATVSLIGRSLRTVGLDEIDQVLDQLLTYEANEHSRSQPSKQANKSTTHSPVLHSGAADRLRAAILSPVAHTAISKKFGNTRPPKDFPDLATYNTILDIITRTVHRSDPARRSASQQDLTQEDDDDEMTRIAEKHLESRSAQLNASLASKMRRLHLDEDAAPLHLSALDRADRLFQSVLDRMQRVSRLEPDHITYNIMITMYSILGRWESVHHVIRAMHDERTLNIACINNALWHWLLRGPASAYRMRGGDVTGSPAVESAFEVYRQLRQNLVRTELASHDSEIAYGSGNANKSPMHRQDRNQHRFQDELGPLTWPQGNESSSDSSLQGSASASGIDAIQAVLGISSLPLEIMPCEITHALMIATLTREGRFADALSVFKDLVSTPLRPANKGPSRVTTRTDGRKAAEVQEDKLMKPTLSIFDSFFRGFSLHGRPSAIVSFDADCPERSTWGPVPTTPSEDQDDHPEAMHPRNEVDEPHAQQLQMWRIETFQEIFDAFLDFEPDLNQVVSPRPQGQVPYGKGWDSRMTVTPLGHLTLSEKRKVDSLRRAPSSNQLFWVLTAIRRVSHDHAGWSLAMWRKVVDKFTTESAFPTSKEKKGKHELAWIGFALGNRLRRVVEHLETRLAEEEQSQNGRDGIEGAEDVRDASQS